jgi:hypothetical protein
VYEMPIYMIQQMVLGLLQGLVEVGNAVGETVYERAKAKYGEDYANRVTRQYISAGTESARATFKTASVALMGLDGFVVGMAIEGVDYAVNLDDYLLGPVILQGYMEIKQAPALKATTYFTVLRPWSLTFYTTSQEFAYKPKMLIATSNLDTMPHLRRKNTATATAMSTSTSGGGGSSGVYTSAHIEFSTIDGSSYTLYQSSNSTDRHFSTIEMWYTELQVACKRVESISKYHAGAFDICEERWLRSLPRHRGWIWDSASSASVDLLDLYGGEWRQDVSGQCTGENGGNTSAGVEIDGAAYAQSHSVAHGGITQRPRRVEGDYTYVLVVESLIVYRQPCGDIPCLEATIEAPVVDVYRYRDGSSADEGYYDLPMSYEEAFMTTTASVSAAATAGSQVGLDFLTGNASSGGTGFEISNGSFPSSYEEHTSQPPRPCDESAVQLLVDMTGKSADTVRLVLGRTGQDVNAALDLLLSQEEYMLVVDDLHSPHRTEEEVVGSGRVVTTAVASPIATVQNSAISGSSNKGRNADRSKHNITDAIDREVSKAVGSVKKQIATKVNDVSVSFTPVTLAGIPYAMCWTCGRDLYTLQSVTLFM